MIGHALALLWDVCFWFFVVSVLVLPVVMAKWRARERADQKATDEQLERCKADTTNDHIFDGA